MTNNKYFQMLQKYLLDWWSNNVKDFPLKQNACGVLFVVFGVYIALIKSLEILCFKSF